MEIKQIVTQTISTLALRWSAILKALVIPCLLSVCLKTFAIQDVNNIQSFILSLLNISIYCLIAINTHRIIILGEESIPPLGLYIPTSREGAFLMHLIVMSLFLLPFIFLLFLLPRITPLIYVPLFLAAYGYLVSRVSLVFPAIATDNSWNFRDSWQVTKKYQKLMLFSVIVVPVALKLLLIGIASIIHIQTVTILLNSVLTVIAIALLSETYKYIEKLETTIE